MTPEHWQRIKALLESALEREPSERCAFLNEACAGDGSLHDEVQSLIESHERAGGFIEEPAFVVMAESLTNDRAESVIGRTLGTYEVIAPLGAGGMGEVYLVEDTKLGRKVALKVLPTFFTRDSERVHRFQQEARAASALNHPNILTIYEIGQMDSRHFIATEFIEGETLRQRMSKTQMKFGEALEVAIQVASALCAAHEAGVIHRDIKPENIMLRRDGYAKVLDFGIAKLTERELTPAGTQAPTGAFVYTEPGAVMGTASYMSPEQARGLPVDARTDIWSLGCVLYEMVAGQVPFGGGTSSDVIASILERKPRPLKHFSTNLPSGLQRIVAKALRKDKEQRYQVASDLLFELTRLKQDLEFETRLGQSTHQTRSSSGATSEKGIERPAAVKAGNELTAQTAIRSTFSARWFSPIKHHQRIYVLGLAALVVALAGIAYFARAIRSVSNEPVASKSYSAVAVLPFANASTEPNAEYMSDGITEGIINSLSQLPKLRVRARSTVFGYKGKESDPQTIGRALSVDAVLTGKVTQFGDSLIIQADLVDVADGSQIWGERYSRKLSDILTVQGEIAKSISEKLRLKLTGEEEKQLTKRYTENTEAYQLYLKGRYYWNKRTEEGFNKSLEYFEQAIAHDPGYALAYAGLADTYLLLGAGDYAVMAPSVAMFKTKAAATRALDIDETIAEAHTSLGFLSYIYDWDWAVAEKHYRRAIELNPNYATAHHWYSLYLSAMLRINEAIAEAQTAQELDPFSLIINTDLGLVFYRARQYDRAIEQLKKTLEMEPNFATAHWNLGRTFLQKQMHSEAIAELRRATELSSHNPVYLAALGHALGVSGRRQEAAKTLNELKGLSKQRYVLPSLIAIIYIGLDNKDQAFFWLEKAYQDRSDFMIVLKVEPVLDGLRTDPRFADLLQRVGHKQ